MFKLVVHLSVFLIPVALIAQQWPPQNAAWHYNDYIISKHPLSEYTRYFVEKDTMIESIGCRVINTDEQGEDFHLQRKIFCSQNNQVYLFWNNDLHLIYDFDAQLNDTLSIFFKAFLFQYHPDSGYTDFDTFLILKVNVTEVQQTSDSLGTLLNVFTCELLEDSLLDEWEVNDREDYVYTERVGLESERFVQLLYSGVFTADRSPAFLRCYDSGDGAILDYRGIRDFGERCDYVYEPTSISEFENQSNDAHLKVRSNSFHDELVLEFQLEKGVEPASVFMLDLHGRAVFKAFISEKQGLLTVPTTQVPSGMYVIVLESQGEVIAREKLILVE